MAILTPVTCSLKKLTHRTAGSSADASPVQGLTCLSSSADSRQVAVPFHLFLRHDAAGIHSRTEIARVTELLARRDFSIIDAATRAGFDNLVYFRKCFRARYGITPRLCRGRGEGN